LTLGGGLRSAAVFFLQLSVSSFVARLQFDLVHCDDASGITLPVRLRGEVMRLLDKIAQAAGPVLVAVPGMPHGWPLPGCNIMAQQLRRCPLRYVLQDDVTVQCTELAFEPDTILATSVEILRVPAPSMWIEFCDRMRQDALQERGLLCGQARSSSAQRIGLLVSSDKMGRKGNIQVCWDRFDENTADLSPFVVEFDFDDSTFSQPGNLTADGSVGVDVTGDSALEPLFKYVRFNLRPEWYRYYINRAQSDIHYRQVLREAVLPLVEDVPLFATFCLLLMSQTAVAQRRTCLTRLNQARAKRGNAPLLDHIELSMNLGEAVSMDAQKGHTENLRSAPRLHFVRGHLVRRGETIFWRTSHMRGRPALGSIRSRTLSLHLGTRQTVTRAVT
jgi:hypothetical protein